MSRFVKTPHGDVVNVDLVELMTVSGHYDKHKLVVRLASGNYLTVGVFDTEDEAYGYALDMRDGPAALFREERTLVPDAPNLGTVLVGRLQEQIDEQHLKSGRVWRDEVAT